MKRKRGMDFGGVDDIKSLRDALLTPPTPHPTQPVLVSEDMVMDHVTLRGLENKLGLNKQDMPEYILHELLDNALDYIESTLSRGTYTVCGIT
jgi:hypothetical protein